MQQIQFMKNLGLIGGFLLLIGPGPGRFALDAMRGRARAIPAATRSEVARAELSGKVVSNCIRAAPCHRC
jgi:hypothetical protein